MKTTTTRLGLTGGIGSGKSTVAAFLGSLGACVIDADAISRSVTASEGAAIPQLVSTFGPGILAADGALDRDKMRTMVFNDPNAKIRLETIVHPLVGLEIANRAHEAAQSKVPCIVFDIPLLVESQHWRQSLDRVLVVDCSNGTQIERVKLRNSLALDAIEKIIAAQASRALRLCAADVVIHNDSISLNELARQVREIGTLFGL